MYKVERTITMYDTIEEIEAKSGTEALTLAKDMFDDDIIYADESMTVSFTASIIGDN